MKKKENDMLLLTGITAVRCFLCHAWVFEVVLDPRLEAGSCCESCYHSLVGKKE